MAEELRPPKGPWRIAQNEWNLQSPPWSGAIAIEDMSEPWLAVPGIVCYLTRGFGQEAAAALIAAAPEMADHVAVLTAEITRLRTELAALRPTPRAHDLGIPPINDQVRAALIPDHHSHASDCASHNWPASEPGPCNCGAEVVYRGEAATAKPLPPWVVG